MTKPTVSTVTAADVREFFRADAKRMEALSPKAQATVKKGAKGLLSPEAVEVHNKRRRTKVYTPGATKAAQAKAKATAQAQREAAAKAGLTVGSRGPLSKAAKAALAQPKG